MVETNPFETMREMAAGYCVARGLHVVANTGVADKLDETSRTPPSSRQRLGPTRTRWVASCDSLLRTV
jgi:hypothetical protein